MRRRFRRAQPQAEARPPTEAGRLTGGGEAGLGKTTLLESFFKSFKDDEALFALFERKETQTVIETRRQLDDAAARRAVCEREMKVAAEKMEYAKAEAKKAEEEKKKAEVEAKYKAMEEEDKKVEMNLDVKPYDNRDAPYQEME